MKIVTSQDTCIAAGQCALLAPNVFKQADNDGKVELLNENPPEAEQDAAREAADLCPSASIRIEEKDR